MSQEVVEGAVCMGEKRVVEGAVYREVVVVWLRLM